MRVAVLIVHEWHTPNWFKCGGSEVEDIRRWGRMNSGVQRVGIKSFSSLVGVTKIGVATGQRLFI